MLSYPGHQVTSSCEIASMRSQGLLEANFTIYKYIETVMSKKLNPLYVRGWDRKICPSWSPFVITRQAS